MGRLDASRVRITKCFSCHRETGLRYLWTEQVNDELGSHGQTLSENSKICGECEFRLKSRPQKENLGIDAAETMEETSTEIVVKVEPFNYEDMDDEELEAYTRENAMDYNNETEQESTENTSTNEQKVTEHGELENIVTVTESENSKDNNIVEKTTVSTEEFGGIAKVRDIANKESKIDKVNEKDILETDSDTDVKRVNTRAAKRKTLQPTNDDDKPLKADHKPKSRRSKYTTKEVKVVLDAVIQKKMTIKQAEEKLQCTRQTVRRMLTRIGFKRPLYERKYTEEQLEEVVSQVVQHKMSCNQALATLQCSRRVLKREFQKIGFKPTASAFQPYTTDQLKEVLAAVTEDRMTFLEGLEALQCSRQTLKRRLDEFIATGDVERHAAPAPRLKSREIDENMRQIFDDVANQRIPIERAKVLLGCGQETLKKKLLEMYGFYKPAKVPTRNEQLVEELQSLLRHTNATPFKMTPGKLCACAYCPYPRGAAELRGNADELRAHVWTEHVDTRVEGVGKMIIVERVQVLKLDVADLKCTTCDIELPWTDIFQHLETVHSIELQQTRTRVIPFNLTTKQLINCVLCPQTFTSLNLVNHHMNTHYTEHTCQQCNTSFMSAVLLKTHERRAHLTVKQFYCEACGKEFTHRNGLVKHTYNTHGKGRLNRSASYTCTECGQKFYANQKLRQHILEEHENVSKYFCESCPDQTFERRSSYLKHVKLLHKGLKYECKLCDKKFHLQCLLRDHEDWHNNHEDYICKTCGAKFVSKAFAKLHRRMHSEEITFACQLCDSKFKSKSGLGKHLTTKHKLEYLRIGGNGLDKRKNVAAQSTVSFPTTSQLKRIRTSKAIKRSSTDNIKDNPVDSDPKNERKKHAIHPVPKFKVGQKLKLSDSVSLSKLQRIPAVSLPTAKTQATPSNSLSVPKTIPNRALVKSLRVRK